MIKYEEKYKKYINKINKIIDGGAKNRVKINGPVNYILLEKNNKKVFVFYDVHGTENEYKDGIHFVDWLKNKFKNDIDFLLEKTPCWNESKLLAPNSDMLSSLRYEVDLDTWSNNIKIIPVDIRLYYNIDPSIINSISNIHNQFRLLMDSISISDVKKYDDSFFNYYKNLINSFGRIIENFNFFNVTLNNDHVCTSSIGYIDLINDTYNKLIDTDKIFFSKKHKEFLEIIDKNITKFYVLFDELLYYINRADTNDKKNIEIYDDVPLEFLDHFDKTYDISPYPPNIKFMVEILTTLSGLIVDLYSVGKILESSKNDIVVYIGASHAKNIVKCLVEHDFIITYNYKEITYPSWIEVYTNEEIYKNPSITIRKK